MTIDNPSDMKELTEKSGESTKDDTNKLSAQERSRTLGDIEGSASTPLKVRNYLPICTFLAPVVLLIHATSKQQS